MLKLSIGLLVAVMVGIGCRWFGVPLPGPPAIMGAAMAVAMAVGYTATDYLMTKRNAPQAPPIVEPAVRINSSPQSTDPLSVASASERS
jgi:XapX domain-containing protein